MMKGHGLSIVKKYTIENKSHKNLEREILNIYSFRRWIQSDYKVSPMYMGSLWESKTYL